MELVMNTNQSVANVRWYRMSGWGHLMRNFAEWRRRARSRDELRSLGDSTLRDMGLTRCDAESEASKPFWMA
jgi:uncharacterized protein YjiS (DUF1127 family)